MENSFTAGQSIFLAALIIFALYFVCRDPSQSKQQTSLKHTENELEDLLLPEKTLPVKSESKTRVEAPTKTFQEV